jgi:hypothetical protein
MRLSAFLIMLSLLTIFATVPAEARPSPVCTELRGQCADFLCADTDLDGKFQWDECIGMYCTTQGCCPSGCPPPIADTGSAAATCTGYMNVVGSKQRTCVDPSNAPACGAWTEGWSSIGYYRACYGTAALCTPSGCPDPIEIYGCYQNLCIA